MLDDSTISLQRSRRALTSVAVVLIVSLAALLVLILAAAPAGAMPIERVSAAHKLDIAITLAAFASLGACSLAGYALVRKYLPL